MDCTLEGGELLYLMTLVVDPEYQRRAIGRLELDVGMCGLIWLGKGSKLLEHLFSSVSYRVKAAYLHVLDTNLYVIWVFGEVLFEFAHYSLCFCMVALQCDFMSLMDLNAKEN